MNKLSEMLTILTRLVFSKTARNTYFVFFGNGLSAFFAFLFTVLYTNNLSWADIGYFSAILSLLLLISDVADMGIGTSLSAFLPPMEAMKGKLLAFLKTAVLLQMVIAIGITGVLLLFSEILGEMLFHTDRVNFLLQISIVGIFFTILANFCQYTLSARQKFMQVAFLSAFGGLVRLFMLSVIFILSAMNLSNTVYIQTLSGFVFLLFSSLFLFKMDFLPVKRLKGDLSKLISFTWLLGIARSLTSIASRLDVLMIISMRGPTEAGIYATASRIILFYPLLTGSFSTVIAPRISVLTEKKLLKQFMSKVILGTVGLLGTVLFLMIFAEPFMVILFPQKGIAAVGVFQLLLMSMFFFVGSIPAVNIAIYFLKKPNILTINSIIQLFLVVCGNLIFIPRFGRFGAAYSLILSYGVTFFLTSFLTYHYFKKKIFHS